MATMDRIEEMKLSVIYERSAVGMESLFRFISMFPNVHMEFF